MIATFVHHVALAEGQLFSFKNNMTDGTVPCGNASNSEIYQELEVKTHK